MRYHEMIIALTEYGYQFMRQCKGTHELWKHRNGSTILVSRSGVHWRGRQNWLQDLKRRAQAEAA